MISLFLLYIYRIIKGFRSLFEDILFVGNLLSEREKVTVPLNLSVTIKKRIVEENINNEDVVGVIKLFAGITPPKGWKICDGSMLLISEYPELYRVIGNTYGGDGKTNFSIPDLRGRVAVGAGNGKNLTPRAVGQFYGSETVVIDINHLPIKVSDSVNPLGSVSNYSVTPDPPKDPIDNIQPSAVLNYMICCEGLPPF